MDFDVNICLRTVTSGFRRDADEICALLGYNAAFSGNRTTHLFKKFS
jgi:hypothetical protein